MMVGVTTKKFGGLVCVVVLAGVAAHAADWLNAGGDGSRSGWQQRERFLRPSNVQDLKLIWKRSLEPQPGGGNALTAPIMIGPFVTHRGIKELVFIAGGSGKVYAVDTDLGRVFWTRKMEAAPSPACSKGLTAAPAMEPERNPRPASAEEDLDFHATMRPLYVLASDGVLHTLLPSTGDDVDKALRFLPAGANASALSFANGRVETVTPGGCGKAASATWKIDVKTGAVSSDAPRLESRTASWTDDSGARWSYTASAEGVSAVRAPGATASWKARKLVSPFQPVIAKGVLFVLDGGSPAGHATLYAFDALSGKELYSSGDQIQAPVTSSGLALANGHLTFADSANTLYCFGFPIEIF